MVSADVKPYDQSDGQLEPRGGLNKEVELGSHGELDNPLLQVSTVGSLGTVFVSVPRATVQRASCFALAGEVPDTLTSAVLVVAVLFFCGLERFGRAIHMYPILVPASTALEKTRR